MNPKRRRQKSLYILFFAAFLLFLNISCFSFDELYGKHDLPDKDLGNKATWDVEYTHEAQTSTAFAKSSPQTKTAAAVFRKQTLIAEKNSKALTETATAIIRAQTQTAAAFDQPPVITKIWVPSVVPANGSTTQGLIYFEDPDGDVDHVNYEVISATSFKSGTKLAPTLNYGTVKKGTYIINIYCELEQDVVMRATLVDKRKHKSNSVAFAFSCRN